MTYPQPLPTRRRWVPVVAALVVGLLVGGGVVGLTWLGSTSERSDVETACAIVDGTTGMDPETDYEQFRRWNAAAELAAVAAESDPRRRSLADALREPADIVMRAFQAKGPEFEAAMARARAACAAV